MNPWACRHCGRHYPVQSLARDCEQTHQPAKEDQ